MMRGMKWMMMLALTLFATSALATAAEPKVDDAIPSYEKTTGVAGNLNSVGSDTLNNLMTYWAESFRKLYPNVRIQIEGKGSSTAPPALIEGTSQLGPMSRPMKPKEMDAFEKKYGFKPTQIGVAIDCVAVYVNKDNPVKGMSLPEVDAIFSKTRKKGHDNIETWGGAGLDGAWKEMPISIYGRNSASGTYGFFKKMALGKGDYKDTVKEQPGSASVVNGVAKDRAGIGYSGIGYKTSEVRVVPLAEKEGGKYYEASFVNAMNGKYPLGRMLYVYTAKKPGEPLPKLVKEFLTFVLSQEGQKIVVKDGYGPLPAPIAKKMVKALE